MTLTLHRPRERRVASVSSTSVRYGCPAGSRPCSGARSRRRKRRLHRRIAEEQLARRIEQRDRVLEMLDGGLQVGLLAGEQRTIGGELLADGVEEVAQLAELVARRQIERHAELALAETRQAAAQDVNRPQQELREAGRPRTPR